MVDSVVPTPMLAVVLVEMPIQPVEVVVAAIVASFVVTPRAEAVVKNMELIVKDVVPTVRVVDQVQRIRVVRMTVAVVEAARAAAHSQIMVVLHMLVETHVNVIVVINRVVLYVWRHVQVDSNIVVVNVHVVGQRLVVVVVR